MGTMVHGELGGLLERSDELGGKTDPVEARPAVSATQCIAVPLTPTCTLPEGRQGACCRGMPARLITTAGAGLCSSARREASPWASGEA
jgi:hypothetical protein